MKLWMKLLGGVVLGLLLGLYVPVFGGDGGDLFAFLSKLVVNIGRYMVFPLCFLGGAVAMYELRTERRLGAVFPFLLLFIVLGTLGLVSLGVLGITALRPSRIPIIIEQQAAQPRPDFGSLLLQIFPDNLFAIFGRNGDFILPLIFFAFFFGLNLTFNRQISQPVVLLLDSLNRIFYHINSFITEFLGFGALALAAWFMVGLRAVKGLELFTELLVVVATVMVVAVGVILPLVLYLFLEKRNPYLWLYSQISPALFAFFSGDLLATLGVALRHGKEDLGIPRKVGAVCYPVATLFCRGGTAMVTGVCFIAVLRSYSSLEIGIFQTLWIIVAAFVISFLLPAAPTGGLFVSLSLISSAYGRGMEEGYLILMPVIFLLGRIGAALDLILASFVSLLVAERLGPRKQPDPANFI
jgi:aerobic C4-dicarboxylate transport protein